ncbi:MAG: hypothetical protein FWE82_05870 [Defluviitaleaceae bacterium]|nr:hypothetical protein [Defluviitaleaceae bacterium]
MSPKELVARTLARKEADRAPTDFGGTVVTCMDMFAHKKLCAFLSTDEGVSRIIDWTMGTVEPCEALMKLFGSDFRRVAINYGAPNIIDGAFINGFGMRLKKADPHEYYETVSHPLEHADLNDLNEMALPDPDTPSFYYGLRDKAKDLHDNSPYAIVADFGVPGFYETSQKLRGYENLACDMLLNREFLFGLYNRLLELQKRFYKNFLGEVGKYAHVVGYADDLGMQDRLQISPEMYRDILKPYHKKIFAFIREHTDAKIMLHCCGAIEPIIGDLADAGVDILNPMQTNAAGMDAAALKKKHGDKIIFWGGIDEQNLLPFGTREEIFCETKKMLDIMAGGGYIIAPSHNIQADTPPENVTALFEAIRFHQTRRA